VANTSQCCGKCEKELPFIGERYCHKCGKQLQIEQFELCGDCKKNLHYFKKGRGVFIHEGPMKDAIYALKYENRRMFADFFVEEINRVLGTWIRNEGFSAIIPIPLSKVKQKSRGYNQAELLGERLSKKTGIPQRLDVIARANDTAPQKLLGHSERKNNLKNAFKTMQDGLQLDRVLLIDDIYTTGNTIDAVARELILAGIHEIYFVAISIGRGF